jgi:hypothetical protein
MAWLIFLFCLGNLALGLWLRPWHELEQVTFTCGFESGRIARNLLLGKGYGSPFVLLPEDKQPKPPLFLAAPLHPSSGDTDSSPKDNSGLLPPSAPPRYLTASDPVPPSAWKTPPTVYLWWICFRLGGLYTVTAWVIYIILQILFVGAAIILFWAAIRRACSPVAAGVAVVLLVAYPPLWRDTIFDTHGIGLFLLLLAISWYAVIRMLDSGSLGWAWLSAGAGAAAVLTLPAAFLFYLFLWPYTAWTLRARSRQKRVGAATPAASRLHPAAWLGVVAACCLALWAPWMIRNAAVLGEPVLFSSNLAMELRFGNSEATARHQYLGHIAHHPIFNELERRQLLTMGEMEYAHLSWREFRAFLQERPRTFLRLVAERVLFFWTWHRHKSNPLRPLLAMVLLFFLFLALICYILVRRTARAPGCMWLERAALGFLALFPLIYYLTHFFDYRYRLPVEFILVGLAGMLFGRLLDHPKKGVAAACVAPDHDFPA